MGAGEAAEGAEQAARAEAMGAIAVDGWWMGSASKRERRALAAEAAVAPPLHMAAEATTNDEEAGKIWGTLSAKEVELSRTPVIHFSFFFFGMNSKRARALQRDNKICGLQIKPLNMSVRCIGSYIP